MAFGRESVINEEQITAYLKDLVSRVESASEADIQALNELKKLFKKNVPFTRRNYVAALLVKQAAGRGRFNHDRNDRFGRGDRNERFNRADRSERTERRERDFNAERTNRTEDRGERAPRVQIDPALSTSIFIGIGRNRRVFPRDLVGLLVSVAGLDRERIGDIKVLANYSFIQLYTEDCEKAIAALNGYDYRGRKLSVSYSKQKVEGEEGNVSENENEAPVSSQTYDSQNETVDEEDSIPANVSNTAHASPVENTEQAKIAAAQSAFAAQQAAAPYSETTDDGQVKSHFGDGAAY